MINYYSNLINSSIVLQGLNLCRKLVWGRFNEFNIDVGTVENWEQFKTELTAVVLGDAEQFQNYLIVRAKDAELNEIKSMFGNKLIHLMAVFGALQDVDNSAGSDACKRFIKKHHKKFTKSDARSPLEHIPPLTIPVKPLIKSEERLTVTIKPDWEWKNEKLLLRAMLPRRDQQLDERKKAKIVIHSTQLKLCIPPCDSANNEKLVS